MKVVKTSNRKVALKKAIDRLNKCLKWARREPILLMVSGGSALELIGELDMRSMGRHVTLTVLDERFSDDPAVNNFSQLMRTPLYRKAERKGVHFIDMRSSPSTTLQGLTRKFGRALKRWRKGHPRGSIIITQGIGEDGHTAGIFPHPENQKKFMQVFENERRWAIGYNVPLHKTAYPRRITVTLPFLREQVDYAVVLATGRAKREVLREVLAKRGNLSHTPARILREMKNVSLFTDQAPLTSPEYTDPSSNWLGFPRSTLNSK